MSVDTSTADPARGLSISAIVPIVSLVFVVFLVTGLALPALPLHVRNELGLGTFVVGLVAGCQFLASLLSRIWAGVYSDTRGSKRAVAVGLLMAAASGLLYFLSLAFVDAPLASVAILMAGRALLGGGESFVITGAQSWGLALAGPSNAGRIIAWAGTAMWAAFAAGAPLGTVLFDAYGFASIAVATTLVPLAALLAISRLRPVPVRRRLAGGIVETVRAVALPGLGLAFSSVGLGVMTAFAVLLSVDRGWSPAWLAFTVFSLAFIVARLLLSHLSDRVGGARVATVFVVVEAIGLAVIWIAPWPILGFAGAAVAGFGYSLVYPGLGLEAVRRVPSENRGLAMGLYTAFLDVALGVLSPSLGLLAGVAGLGSVFLASALLVLCGAPIAAWLLLHSPTPGTATP
ncbi:arabinose transporter [Labrys wisconsinensis]|uniref:MFS family permease n=1 Tax=Labrys wisconsinensis TaxID=425677 RepID=A0ABU0J710_9HYPH|nr:arabinose transporter [Labrys wisconsinensis]MDQ0470048.1 MFS family permease [Labrys wisconsinensis]